MIRGNLFTRFYLDDGIRETEAYRALDPARWTRRVRTGTLTSQNGGGGRC